MRISIRHTASIDDLDALIISGGDDVHPSLYGEDELPEARYDPRRDLLEQVHIEQAMNRGLPILGICRGYQLMNVVNGGQLYSDIRPMRSRTSNRGTILARKKAVIEVDSTLHELVQAEQLTINSLHHQAVKMTGRGYRCVARDKDGFTQAVEHVSNSNWIGVQWHPEYLWYLPKHLCLFKWLVSRCNQSQGQ